MLTNRQRDLLGYIEAHIFRTGLAPTFSEMREAMSLKSKSGIHRLLEGLEHRGFIRRLPNRARALEIVRLPDDITIVPGRRHFIAGTSVDALFDRIAALPLADSARAERAQILAFLQQWPASTIHTAEYSAAQERLNRRASEQLARPGVEHRQGYCPRRRSAGPVRGVRRTGTRLHEGRCQPRAYGGYRGIQGCGDAAVQGRHRLRSRCRSHRSGRLQQ